MTVGDLPAWISARGSIMVVRFYVQPKASRTELVGTHGDGTNARLKIRVAAPPVDGAANEELLGFLKKITRLSRSQLRIIRGETSRQKDVQFEGIEISALMKILE